MSQRDSTTQNQASIRMKVDSKEYHSTTKIDILIIKKGTHM